MTIHTSFVYTSSVDQYLDFHFLTIKSKMALYGF